MLGSHQHESQPVVDVMVDAFARSLERALGACGSALDTAELRVHAWRVGRDPDNRAWVADMRQRADAGTLVDDAVDFDLLRTFLAEDQQLLD